jgi:DinB superfamily
MFVASFSRVRANGWLAGALFVAGLVLAPSSASAQAGPDVMTKESAAVVKAAFLADLDVMRGKFVGLAEAFPPDKYSWRPMEGVRSVAEVLMLIASEGYGFAPTSLGGKAALSREEMGALSKITDKAQVINHLTKGFAHARQALEAIDPATLVGRRRAMGQERTTPEIVLFVAGDMHEHLGQLIAYARMNRIVPPWSK